MQNSERFVDNTKFKLIAKLGFFTSIVTNIIFIIILFYVHKLSLQGDFPWYDWELSELVLNGEPSKFLFDIAIIINGLGLLGAIVPLTFYLPNKRIQIAYLIMAAVVDLSLIGIGAFPEDTFKTTHYILGVTFFLSASILICYISTVLVTKMKDVPLIYAITGYFTFLTLIFHLATRSLFGMAITQRLAVLFSIIFLLMIGGYFIFRKETKKIEKHSSIGDT